MKPKTFKSSELWHQGGMMIMFAKDNLWLQNGDIIISAYEHEGTLHASGESVPARASGTPRQLSAITKAWSNNEEDYPVKTGFNAGEPFNWFVYRNDTLREIIIMSVENVGGLFYAKAEIIPDEVSIEDNLFYSIAPIWPAVDSLQIAPPKIGKTYLFPEFMNYGQIMPKYLNNVHPVINETSSITLTVSKFFNSCKIKFNTQAAIDAGAFILTIAGDVYVNSGSTANSKSFKIYWK